MKIGIITLFHNNANYGGVLQGYALKTHLERLCPGAQVDILKYQSRKNAIYPHRLLQALQYSPVEIIRRATNWKIKGNVHSRILSQTKRLGQFNQFTEQCTTNHKVYTDSNLVHAAEEYDVLICGSDQIWNPNVSKPGFYLSSISQECVKVSYAASIARDDLRKRERNIMIPLISRFDFVSVRERTAVDIIQKYSRGRLNVKEVLDPVFLLRESDWSKISNYGANKEKYALAYFFSDSKNNTEQIIKFCEQKGLKLKKISFNPNEIIKADEEYICEKLYDIGPYEFLGLFRNASYVFTDSFHGTAFSILFKKPFCVFERDKKSKVSKNSRLYDLLKKFELNDRLMNDFASFDKILNSGIDYLSLESRLEQYRAESNQFLIEAISSVKGEKRSICRTVEEMKDYNCCGCGLCAVICPEKCISMIQSTEGFYYPKIDEVNCIGCGKCISECEARKTNSIADSAPICYVGYSNEDAVRLMSSSGGLFYELGKAIIHENGVVYGAKFSQDFAVEHARVDSLIGLNAILTSKYVQSKMDIVVYEQVLSDLDSGRKVLFAGTPCQVAAIQRIANEKHMEEKLYTVDFVCHGVPSPSVWKSYVSYQEKKNGKEIDSINFRDKKHGSKSWHDFSLLLKFVDESSYYRSHELDPYMQAFLSNRNLRPSCYDCLFKDRMYKSDITMGDAWKIERVKKEWSDDKGTSVIIVRSEKGEKLLKMLTDSFSLSKSTYDLWTRFNPAMIQPSSMPSSRADFFCEFSKRQSDESFWKNIRKRLGRKRVSYFVKRTLIMTRLDRVIRRRL